jgi:hypothetical protein
MKTNRQESEAFNACTLRGEMVQSDLVKAKELLSDVCNRRADVVSNYVQRPQNESV